eukprot:CAMPEP_0206228086 /NCGR_PEP_ID=MMETSP0047_2-20121206/8979_1 /ASSEMBLY_ACC=CAM_ASM_000192 /TAXON_ID=195065 /ORGANISM="Chroomonas mesostigmatica_cf, Strain CCMP1168" /LENGTH=825 /DNA_ID=CAMNT_0053651301 /DNA_START=70 /DNA_END=2548 /DNA_ORIENTATION=-
MAANPIDMVAQGLYIGGQRGASDLNLLKQHGITHVINAAAATCNCFYPQDFLYKALKLVDTPSQNLLQHFPETTAFINEARMRGGRVFVHCIEGKSRSASIVLAFLMDVEGMSLQDAYALLKRVRPFCNPNEGFQIQLQHHENLKKGSRPAQQGLQQQNMGGNHVMGGNLGSTPSFGGPKAARPPPPAQKQAPVQSMPQGQGYGMGMAPPHAGQPPRQQMSPMPPRPPLPQAAQKPPGPPPAQQQQQAQQQMQQQQMQQQQMQQQQGRERFLLKQQQDEELHRRQMQQQQQQQQQERERFLLKQEEEEELHRRQVQQQAQQHQAQQMHMQQQQAQQQQQQVQQQHQLPMHPQPPASMQQQDKALAYSIAPPRPNPPSDEPQPNGMGMGPHSQQLQPPPAPARAGAGALPAQLQHAEAQPRAAGAPPGAAEREPAGRQPQDPAPRSLLPAAASALRERALQPPPAPERPQLARAARAAHPESPLFNQDMYGQLQRSPSPARVHVHQAYGGGQSAQLPLGATPQGRSMAAAAQRAEAQREALANFNNQRAESQPAAHRDAGGRAPPPQVPSRSPTGGAGFYAPHLQQHPPPQQQHGSDSYEPYQSAGRDGDLTHPFRPSSRGNQGAHLTPREDVRAGGGYKGYNARANAYPDDFRSAPAQRSPENGSYSLDPIISAYDRGRKSTDVGNGAAGYGHSGQYDKEPAAQQPYGRQYGQAQADDYYGRQQAPPRPSQAASSAYRPQAAAGAAAPARPGRFSDEFDVPSRLAGYTQISPSKDPKRFESPGSCLQGGLDADASFQDDPNEMYNVGEVKRMAVKGGVLAKELTC